MADAIASFLPCLPVSAVHFESAVARISSSGSKCDVARHETCSPGIHFAVKTDAGSDGIVKSASFLVLPACGLRPRSSVSFTPSFVDRSLPMAILLQRRHKQSDAMLDDFENDEDLDGGDDGFSNVNNGHGRGRRKCPTCSDTQYVDCSYCETEDGMIWDYTPFTPVSRFRAWGPNTRGIFPLKFSRVLCPKCDGTSLMPCPTCNSASENNSRSLIARGSTVSRRTLVEQNAARSKTSFFAEDSSAWWQKWHIVVPLELASTIAGIIHRRKAIVKQAAKAAGKASAKAASSAKQAGSRTLAATSHSH
mmetsp:Transcript_10534/g.18452  ORF Transcript_10534/g.18452 Transcript_10534/m.18452 type:complete len:307 (+) Transcript_10534:103-1023(+)